MIVNNDVLEIKGLQYTDEGTYQCFVESAHGTTSTATKVEVQGTDELHVRTC